MSAVYLGYVFTVNDDGFILRNVFIGKMDHYIVIFEIVLKGFYINACNVLIILYCKTCNVGTCLTRNDCGRNYADNVPGVTRA